MLVSLKPEMKDWQSLINDFGQMNSLKRVKTTISDTCPMMDELAILDNL